jgi:hypothetical protein
MPGWVAPPFDHVLGDARLRDLNPELQELAVNAQRAAKQISTLIRRINACNPVSICGRPTNGRDFLRQ